MASGLKNNLFLKSNDNTALYSLFSFPANGYRDHRNDSTGP
jgi:hypothetical protein